MEMNSNASNAISTLFWGHTGEFWDACLMWSVVFAAIAAGTVGVTTIGSIRSHKLEADAAEHGLEKYKNETAGKVADAHLTGIAAGERAGTAQAAADDAHVKLKEAEAQIADANARAAEAEKQAAALNIETAQIKADSLRLEQQLAWRKLSPEEVKSLISALAPYAGQKVKTKSILGDSEGLLYRRDFISVFEKAGWISTPDDGSQDVFTDPPMGVQVIINPADGWRDSPDHITVLGSAGVLGSTLSDLKIIPQKAWGMDPKVPEGTVLLLIGVKPPPHTP